LPAPDASGSCTSHQALPYLRDVPPFGCSLTPLAAAPLSASASVSLLAALCATTLNASALNAAALAQTPTVTALATPLPLSFLLERNYTGAYSSVTRAPASYFDATTATCHDGLVGYQLLLTAAGTGSLVSASAYLRVADLPAHELPTTTTYAAAYRHTGAAPISRRIAGRPGYERGKPLLLAEGTQMRVDPLGLLPRTLTGHCAGAHDAGSTPVLFGEDLAVSCVSHFSPTELAAWCSAALPLTAQPLFAALNLSDGSSLVGVYGDSHPLMTSDWVPLRVRYPQNNAQSLTPTWDPATQTCSNVLAGIHLRVLVADVGAIQLPSTKVLGVELILTSRDVAASRAPLGRSSTTVLTTTATATFARLDTTSFEFVPDSPQLIPPLPYDFFYPFTESA